jgi:hypothetical protein
MKKSELIEQEKNKVKVQRTLELIRSYGFSEKTVITKEFNEKYTRKKYTVKFWKPIRKDICMLFYHLNPKAKIYRLHCFDLFLSNSNNLNELDLDKEENVGKFWIGGFDIDNIHHILILTYLMKYDANDAFTILDHRLFKMRNLENFCRNDITLSNLNDKFNDIFGEKWYENILIEDFYIELIEQINANTVEYHNDIYNTVNTNK